jgi:hypothetical protein
MWQKRNGSQIKDCVHFITIGNCLPVTGKRGLGQSHRVNFPKFRGNMTSFYSIAMAHVIVHVPRNAEYY